MPRHILAIAADIDALPSVDGDDVDRLKLLIDEYFDSDSAAEYLDVWFRLFERFPDEDGFESFWSILHGIEAQAHYEAEVIESLIRRPSDFPLLMVNRMLNSGIDSVNGIDLLLLLQQSANHERATEQGQESALRFVEYQRGHAD
jgi:hypothetical protein